jgi:hypothetical protein
MMVVVTGTTAFGIGATLARTGLAAAAAGPEEPLDRSLSLNHH